MWNFLTQLGLVTATVEFPGELSVLLFGLIGVVWFSAGMLAWVAIRHYVSQRTTLPVDRAPAAVDCRDAA